MIMSDKVAIVTNATSDIGWAISKQLMAKKVRVIGTGDDEAVLGDASQHYELFDGQVVDPIAEDAVKNFVKQAIDKYGEIDYSFQIAVPYQAGLIIDEQLTDWNFMIDLALNGVFLFIKNVGRQMKKQGSGQIVNIASMDAHVQSYCSEDYAAIKSAVNIFTKSAALELAAANVQVNSILPGIVDSYPAIDEHSLDQAETLSVKRPARPEEIAGPAIFLTSEEASYINGTTLVVDGGWEITGYPDVRM